MKINIVKHIRQEQEIDVDLPYYFEASDTDGDEWSSETFGKVDERITTMIRIREVYGDGKEYRFESQFCHPSEHAKYLNGDYRSTKEKFNQALDKILAELGRLRGENENESNQ